ncbi:Octopine permease ATP-binding protein P [Aquimixticola soesokkakensis]|uniref:Octopine permease ATP-binding protein P n=1 Tax=Aquimixticola soesokkakensis TaxID=1519096 RepID=A0A1Y5S1N2_9RHOB|nr:Octopine permease ATP-binding protein P [Aquimixticola soesokkakensis]
MSHLLSPATVTPTRPLTETGTLETSFGDTQVLKAISLKVRQGEPDFVIGSSGSGKSTMLRCGNRLEAPTLALKVMQGLRDQIVGAPKSECLNACFPRVAGQAKDETE